MPKMLGYFTNTLAKLNRYIEREQKNGSDIPRFTKGQIRLIVRHLERKDVFRYRHEIDCPGGQSCQCDRARVQEFKVLVRSLNRKLPGPILELLV
jgi:hypothetical protein